MNFLTLKKLLSLFKLLNLSSLPSANPGSGQPWLHSSGSIVVGAFTGGSGSVAWADVTGKPTEFPPTLHIHSATDVSSGTLADARLSSNVVTLAGMQVLTNKTLVADAIRTVTGFSLSEKFGDGASVSGNRSTALGNAASASVNGVAVGYGATAGGASVALGDNAAASGGQSFALGIGASSPGSAAIAIGAYAVGGINGVSIGGNSSSGIYSIAIGVNSNSAHMHAIAIGHSAATTSNNQMMIGGPGHEITSVAFASGGMVVKDSTGAGSGFVDARLRPYTVAGLPLASASEAKEFFVTDSTVAMTPANYGAVAVGGGSFKCRVLSNGTNWVIA